MPDAAMVLDLAWLLELNMGLVMPDAARGLELARVPDLYMGLVMPDAAMFLDLDMGLVMAMAFGQGSA